MSSQQHRQVKPPAAPPEQAGPAHFAGILDAPAGRHYGQAARDWEQAALGALIRQLTDTVTACSRARDLAIGAAARTAIGPHPAAPPLLLAIAAAAGTLDEAHEIAHEMSLPAEYRCRICDGQVARIPGSRHWHHIRTFSAGRATAMHSRPAHRPQVVTRPRLRRAIVGGRIDPDNTGR